MELSIFLFISLVTSILLMPQSSVAQGGRRVAQLSAQQEAQADKQQKQEKKTITYQDFLSHNTQVVEALKKSQTSQIEAAELLQKWEPVDENLATYKQFWTALWNTDFQKSRVLYDGLKKKKKFLRLRLELVKHLLEQNPATDVVFLKRESRTLIRQLSGTSEGELFESTYLKWLEKHSFFIDICTTERSRWITEPEIDFIQMSAAIHQCPLKFENFLARLRRLIFAAKEFQAQREIDIYSKNNEQGMKLEDWQKAYIQAIFDSNVGDPIKAFQDIVKYEKQILESDYNVNYFYIAQRAGELKKAEELIDKVIARAKPKDKRDLTFQKGFLYYQTRNYDKAYTIFDDLYKTHPHRNHKRKPKDYDQISWLRAWVLFLSGKYDQSLKAFQATEAFTNDSARLNYWIAVNQMQLQDTGSAVLTFRKLADPILSQKSFSFYNLLGWIRYQSYRSQFKNSELIKNIIAQTKQVDGYYPTPDDSISRSQLLSQYNEMSNESFTTDEGQIQVVNTENEVLSSAELQGITVESRTELLVQIYWSRLLIEQKENELAKWHMFELEKNIKERRAADSVSQFYLDNQFYYRSLSLQQRINNVFEMTMPYKNDPLYWGSIFPEAYKTDVMKFANQRKVDPYLVWSIMKAETQYKSDAISPVGAVGLMQFMPYTLEKIAKLVGNSVKTQELFEPAKSIEYGAAYIKKLSLELDYQKPLIAAAYNGGPHRVKQWLKNLGQLDYDVFVEHIPFAETRTYTKRVLTFRATYDRLYAGNQFSYDKFKYLTEKIPFKPAADAKLSEDWDFNIK